MRDFSPRSRAFVRVLVLFALLAVWIPLFIVGYSVPSFAIRSALGSTPPAAILTLDTLRNVLSVGLTWTWTNSLLLCIVASLIGEVARGDSLTRDDPLVRSAMARAFFVYLFVLAGQMVIGGGTPQAMDDSLTSGRYLRIAAFTSLLGFFIGYQREAFAKLLHKAGDLLYPAR